MPFHPPGADHCLAGLVLLTEKGIQGRSSRWDISLEQLISMVHERPELWDTECPRYSDRYRKKKVWDEVCAMLTPDWAILSERQKKQRGENQARSSKLLCLFCFRFYCCNFMWL